MKGEQCAWPLFHPDLFIGVIGLPAYAVPLIATIGAALVVVTIAVIIARRKSCQKFNRSHSIDDEGSIQLLSRF